VARHKIGDKPETRALPTEAEPLTGAVSMPAGMTKNAAQSRITSHRTVRLAPTSYAGFGALPNQPVGASTQPAARSPPPPDDQV
jgi:hypothetical protein